MKTGVDLDPYFYLFVVKDKTRAGPDDVPGEITAETFTGVIALLNGSPANALVEIGHILILSKCQRTHVLTNAAGTLLLVAILPRLPQRWRDRLTAGTMANESGEYGEYGLSWGSDEDGFPFEVL